MNTALAPLLPLAPELRRSQPARLLMTTDTVGGVWTYTMELCHGLAAAGVNIVLAAMGAPVSSAQAAEAAAIPGLLLEEGAFKLEWMDAAADDVARAGEWLLRLSHKHRPELVHLNGYAHGALPWTVPLVVVAHSCVHTWWQAVKGGPAPSSFDHYTRQLRAGVAAADRLVAPTAAFLRDFRAAHGQLPPTEVVPNGRSGTRFAPAARKAPFFLSVGRLWDEAKNAQLLASIAPELPWPVRVAGDAASPDGRLQELPNLDLLGRCTPELVAELMSQAAVYVLPAKYEPFGLSVLEAALSGCALVLGDIPSLRELWQEAAIFIPPDDAGALARSLRRLADDAETRRDLGARALERAQTFTATAMTRRYLAIYQALLGTTASPRRTAASATA